MASPSKVPAKTSSFSYKGRNVGVKQIAADLGVAKVLEGTVQAAGKQMRISVQLINASTGLTEWSKSFQKEYSDLFKLQDDVVTQLVQAMKVNLHGRPAASVIQAPSTKDVEAYRLYLQAIALLNSSAGN